MACILVTAATGRVGTALIPRLTAAGHEVLAVTSRQDGVQALRQSGVEPVLADLGTPQSLELHMGTVDAVFLATPDDPRQDAMERGLVGMFAQNGNPHVVKLSAQSAGLNPPVSFGAYHRRAEEVLEESGLPYTILRPTFFQQSLLLFAEDVASKGKITAPVGSGKVAMVNVDDVAEAASVVLANEEHFGRTYTLTGPSAHSFADVTSRLSELLVKKVGYTSPPAFAARLVLPFVTGMPRWKSNLVVDLLSALRAGAQENSSSDIEDITGKAPKSLEMFLTSNLDAFKS
ncbi:NAD(P)H-binding protein [Hoeflea sp. TYP-13]|uniref:NAD(P)H-binding protein n=1 Tax=Hoeflea sp. TYP-13 TaxID=3230023 RepID=UPI0034C5C31F